MAIKLCDTYRSFEKEQSLMSGKIKEIIDRIIKERARGNPVIAEMTKAKLILKGIYPDKYDSNDKDDPEIIEKLIEIKKQLNAEESIEESYNLKSAFSVKETEEEIVLEIQTQLINIGAKVLIFFASSAFNQNKLSQLMQNAFEDCIVFGCSTAGERFNEKILTNSVVALALSSNLIADAKVEVIQGLNSNFNTKQTFTSFDKYFNESTYTMDPTRYAGIVLIDGLSLKEEKLMDEIGNLTDINFVGGSAGDNLKYERTTVYANGKAYNDSAVIALLKMQKKAGFSIIETQSFNVLDPILVANKVNEESREVIEFNHKPAVQAYADALGVLSLKEIPKYFLSHPVGLVIDENNVLVRSPHKVIGSNIKFFCNILKDMEVRLLEDGDIVKETQKAIEQKKKVLGKKITGILSFDCIHRRVELENKNLVEQYGELFADIPTIGFYSYGEVHIGHMNQTATMLIFEYNSLNHNVRQENRLLSKEKQRLTQANYDLKREVFELKRKLKLATRALKQFNIALEAEINERTKREEEIRYLSYHDELTGLYNRRFYEEAIKNLDTKTNLPISIIIGDVNDLKIVNDTLGHAKGDELLQKSAMILKTACRKEDVIVRFGGDEFIILLSQTSKEVAQEIIRRIDQLSSKQFVNSFPISISFGWDAKENSEENILEVLNNAEKSMYKRKALYKNEIL